MRRGHLAFMKLRRYRIDRFETPTKKLEAADFSKCRDIRDPELLCLQQSHVSQTQNHVSDNRYICLKSLLIHHLLPLYSLFLSSDNFLKSFFIFVSYPKPRLRKSGDASIVSVPIIHSYLLIVPREKVAKS